MTEKFWKTNLKDSAETILRFASDEKLLEACSQFSQMVIDCYRSGGTVFVCGNGGSHCDAMHFAEELTGRYRKDRKPLGALALGDASHLSCVANDYGFDYVYSRQLEALARKGDLLLVLSTSGRSKNLLLTLQKARELNIKSIALLGREGGEAKDLADHAVVVPAQTSDRIQEVHIQLIHIVIESVERELFPELY